MVTHIKHVCNVHSTHIFEQGLKVHFKVVSIFSATSEWISFFKDAGIPAGPAVNYAVTFVDNRISKNMLLDLNKEIMNELGITVVGDVIAILKHAKVVHQQLREPMVPLLCLSQSGGVSRTAFVDIAGERWGSELLPSYRTFLTFFLFCGHPLSVAVSSPPTDTAEVPVKRRKVTAEIEGKYVINMPKGTTPRTKKILEEQAAKSLTRTSVFDRLGAESNVDTTTVTKPTGVFSRLGDSIGEDHSPESDEEGSVLQYAGVLKRKGTTIIRENLTPGVTVKAKATSSEPKPAITTIRRLATKPPASAAAKLTTPKISMAQRLGTVKRVNPEEGRKRKMPSAALVKRLGKLQSEAQDSKVSSSKPPPTAFKITIKRTIGNPRVTSSSDNRSAQMDNTRSVSVFKRLGRKSV
ncbi:hypothetical protein AB205_0163250 [Aquarana catesbeiana]|uniref:DUF5577 domain-containing protein n=1 Tax=Aquarana catesbeiana TaxID=8400 RepID=A0A2G9SGD8_AQUCT|nr:hypothetical protein AB205_0163250 [Aquarana catesbeiana]